MIGGRDFRAVDTNVSNMKEGAIIEKSLTPPVDATPNPEVNNQAFEESVNTHMLVGLDRNRPYIRSNTILLFVLFFVGGGCFCTLDFGPIVRVVRSISCSPMFKFKTAGNIVRDVRDVRGI